MTTMSRRMRVVGVGEAWTDCGSSGGNSTETTQNDVGGEMAAISAVVN